MYIYIYICVYIYIYTHRYVIDMYFCVCRPAEVFQAVADSFLSKLRSLDFVKRASLVEVVWAAAVVFVFVHVAPWNLQHGYSTL